MPLFGRPRTPSGPARLPVSKSFGDPSAAKLLLAFRASSWPAAQEVLAEATGTDHLTLLLDSAADISGLESWLPDIVRDDLDDTLPSVLYGARLIRWGWEARTGLRAKYVSRDRFALFHERLLMAEDCLQSVVRREPGNAPAWHYLLLAARGLQLGVPEARRRFDQAVAKDPEYIRAHMQMLQMVCKKWYGSHEQMHDFARTAMLGAPPGSPLGHLVALAHLEEALNNAEYIRDIEARMKSRRVRAALSEAADRSVRHPEYRRGPDWANVHSAFAMAFALAGDGRAAAEQFRVLGDVVLEFPWEYLGDDAGAVFCQRRNWAFARG